MDRLYLVFMFVSRGEQESRTLRTGGHVGAGVDILPVVGTVVSGHISWAGVLCTLATYSARRMYE